MQKFQQTPIIQNQIANSMIASHSTLSSDLGIYKLKFPKNDNFENRNKEDNKYQKKIQMYTQSVKERMLPKNITEAACCKVAQSKNISMVESNTSFGFNNQTNTNAQSNFQNTTFSKQFTGSQFYYPKVDSFPTILTASQVKNSQLLVSTQEKQEQPIIEGKGEPSTNQNVSSRNYTYRSVQSTNLNSGEQTNKCQLSKQNSSQSPTKLFSKSGIQFENSFSYSQITKEKQQNELFFKNYFSFQQEGQNNLEKTLLKDSKKEKKHEKRYHSASLDHEINKIPYMDQSVNSFIINQPQNIEKNLQDSDLNKSIQSQSDLSLSKIECENSLIESTNLMQQNQQQNNIQSFHHDSCSFNFHQPTVIDINSKKNSILSTKDLVTLFSLGQMNKNKNQQFNDQNNEQKFIKSLLSKLNQINQQNQNLYSVSDLTLEGSAAVNGKATNDNTYLKNNTMSKDNQLIVPSNLNSLNKNIIINDQQQSNNQNQKCNNKDSNQRDQSPSQKKITIIRNTSQTQITPIKIMHKKCSSQTNLESKQKFYNPLNSQQQTCESTYQSNTTIEKEFHEIAKTEFSSISPIHSNTLSAFANKKRERSYQSVTLPTNSFKFEHNIFNTSSNNSQLNTARLQAKQGWKCC